MPQNSILQLKIKVQTDWGNYGFWLSLDQFHEKLYLSILTQVVTYFCNFSARRDILPNDQIKRITVVIIGRTRFSPQDVNLFPQRLQINTPYNGQSGTLLSSSLPLQHSCSSRRAVTSVLSVSYVLV